MSKSVRIFLALILTAGISTGVAACSSNTDQGLRTYSTVPDFTLNDLQGQSVSLSQYKGQIVYLNFWSSTCQPCKDEMPNLQAVYSEWSAKGLVFLTLDEGEDLSTVKDFVQSLNYTFPVLLDRAYQVAGKYNVRYTPTSLFINKEGKLQSQIIGAFKNKADKADIEAQLNNLFQ